MEGLKEKRCSKCSTVKPLADFPARKRNPDGTEGVCRVCTAERAKALSQRHAQDLMQRSPEDLPRDKSCSGCGLVKPLTEFNLNKSRQDGREGRCKSCRGQARRRQYAAYSQKPPDAALQEKRCSVCDQIKPVAQFFRESRRPDGYNRRCKACHNEWLVQRRDKLAVRLEAAPVADKHCPACGQTKPAAQFHKRIDATDQLSRLCAACTNQEDREKRWALRGEPGSYEAYLERRTDAYRKKRNAEIARARRAGDPEKEHVYARKYYHQNRDRILRQTRARRRADVERVRHRDRVYYWKNPERKRLIKRLSLGRSRGGDAKPFSPSRYRAMSLNAPFASGKGERADIIADARVISPELAAVAAPSLQAVRAFVAEELTEQERLVLEAFADTGFSAVGAAELLDMAEADVVAVMGRVRARAAASQLSDEAD